MSKLSKEQERELARRAKQGDKEAPDQLIKSCEPLVRSIANDVCHAHGCHEFQDDLISEGNLALFKQISKFDLARGTRFSTFVWQRIDGAMRESLWHNKSIDIYGSRAKWEFARDVRLAHDELMNALPEKPTVEEIADLMTVSIAEVEKVLHYKEQWLADHSTKEAKPKIDTKSITQQTGLPLWKARRILNKHSDIERKAKTPDLSPKHIAEKLRVTPQEVDEALELLATRELSDGEKRFAVLAADCPSPEEVAMQNEMLKRLRRAIQELPVDQKRVFLLHHFEGLTLEEISATTNINLNTVKSHLRRALAYLKRRLQDGGKRNA